MKEKETNKQIQTNEAAVPETKAPSALGKEEGAKDMQMKIASEKLRYENADSIYPE